MSRCKAALLATLLFLGLARTAHADLLDEAWKRGNDAYFHGDFAAAIAAYEQLDRQEVVARDLYYNLGVAHFRQGNLGRAIWSFERALGVDPEDEDARFNLAQARKLAERRVLDKIENAGSHLLEALSLLPRCQPPPCTNITSGAGWLRSCVVQTSSRCSASRP